MIRNSMTKKVQAFFSQSNRIAYGLKTGPKIKETRMRIVDIANDRHTLQLTDHPTRTPIVGRQQRQTYSFVSEHEVTRREEKKKIITSYLLDTNVTDNVFCSSNN